MRHGRPKVSRSVQGKRKRRGEKGTEARSGKGVPQGGDFLTDAIRLKGNGVKKPRREGRGRKAPLKSRNYWRGGCGSRKQR